MFRVFFYGTFVPVSGSLPTEIAVQWPEKGCVPTAIVSGIWFHWLVDSIESSNVAIDDPVQWVLQGFASHSQTLTSLFSTCKMFFNCCHILYWHHYKISVLTHDFQHITSNCQTQSCLRRVENHVEELKLYCDANTTFDCFWKTSSRRWIMKFTFGSKTWKTL